MLEMDKVLQQVRAALDEEDTETAARLLHQDFIDATRSFEKVNTHPCKNTDRAWENGDWRSMREFEEALEAGELDELDPKAESELSRCRDIAMGYREELQMKKGQG